MIERQHHTIKRPIVYHQQALNFVRSRAKKTQKIRLIRIVLPKELVRNLMSIKQKAAKRDQEKANLFVGIYKSDRFTIEAAHKAFAKVAKNKHA